MKSSSDDTSVLPPPLCACPERPRCQSRWCDDHASWTVMRPRMTDEPSGGPRFMCNTHYEMYRDVLTKPTRGLDPLTPNDEYFKPSIAEMIRHGQIAAAFDDRKTDAESQAVLRAGDRKRYSESQLPQVLALRRALNAGATR